MKKLIFLVSVIFTTYYSFSQDIIIQKDGSSFECKITKVDSLNVYFNIFRNGQEISTFLNKNEIQSIQYGNAVDQLKNNDSGGQLINKEYELGFNIPINFRTIGLFTVDANYIENNKIIGIHIGFMNKGLSFSKSDNTGTYKITHKSLGKIIQVSVSFIVKEISETTQIPFIIKGGLVNFSGGYTYPYFTFLSGARFLNRPNIGLKISGGIDLIYNKEYPKDIFFPKLELGIFIKL
ncbi:MAG: hypothetical protein JXB17_12695 [Bacteroidales bacterium]|nr:hypothetical protein [Bacteroidales bacterium]